MAEREPVRLSEVVACLALATDLGMGQPLEHALRTCLVALRTGEALGLSSAELADTYYVSLLRFVGCTSHAHEDHLATGDEIAFRAGIAPILNGTGAEMLGFTITRMGQGAPSWDRVRIVAGALAAGSRGARQAISTTCEVAQIIAARLGMGDGVLRALAFTYEHHDGTGYPAGAAGDEIPVAAHIAMVARDFEILYRLGGRELVLEVAARRRGRAYSPRVLDGFLKHAWEPLQADPEPTWESVVNVDPNPGTLSGPALDDALRCFADFSDIRSPYTHGFSPAVSELVGRAGRSGLLDEGQARMAGAAALVQELGMAGVSNALLEKKGPLTDSEWERVRLHPYLTERILVRAQGLARIGSLAAAHHERPDGSGYPRGVAAAQLTPAARLLAAAGSYVALTADRPWRPALPSGEAAVRLSELARAGVFDVQAVDAVLAAAGERVARHHATWPAGLTDREVEVLRLISRGKSNRDVAAELVVSPKTVGRHIENIYSKLGVSSRAAAAVFALQHGLVPPAGAAEDF